MVGGEAYDTSLFQLTLFITVNSAPQPEFWYPDGGITVSPSTAQAQLHPPIGSLDHWETPPYYLSITYCLTRNPCN